MHTYQLKIYYPKKETSQNDNQGASFSAHVEIKSITKPKNLGFETIQRGALKNKVFNTKEPGTLKVQLICNNSEQKSGGTLFPMAFCMDFEISGGQYVLNENTNNTSDKYTIEMSEYYDVNKVDFNKSSGDSEVVNINITQDIVDNYNGKVPFDYIIRSSVHPDIPLAQLQQAYWFRLYFVDSQDTTYLLDWLHVGNDGTPPSDDGTGGVDGTEIEETEETAIVACQYSDCEI